MYYVYQKVIVKTTTKGENCMGILIQGGRIVDAATDTDKKAIFIWKMA